MQALIDGVTKAVAEGSIGRPVALRLHAFVVETVDKTLPAATGLLAMANRWFAGKLVRIEGRGSVASLHLTMLAEFAGGETALVSVHRRPNAEARLEFLLLGSQGMLRHDDVLLEFQDPPTKREDQTIHDAISRALDESLKQGAPASVTTSP